MTERPRGNQGYRAPVPHAAQERRPVRVVARPRTADFAPAVAAGAGAVLAASVFHCGEVAIGDVKDGLRASGYPVR